MASERQEKLSLVLAAIGGDVKSLRETTPTVEAAGNIAAGSTLGLEQGLLAAAGQPGLTVLAVGYTTSGKVQGVSLGDGNVVEAYASGDDFNAGNVLYREFMSLGEPICFTGLMSGAIITSTQGFYGCSEQVDGGDESPMPLLSYGLSFTETFFFAFRNSNVYAPTGTSGSQGWVHIVNGPLDSVVKLTDGAGTTVQGQENIVLKPWEYRRLYTNANAEYILSASNPVMACINANMDNNPFGRFYDSRLIMPLTSDGITWPRSGMVSAPYLNTLVRYAVRDGAEGSFITSPGQPTDFDGVTGAADADYEPNGATRIKATGLVSAFSGADNAGLEASPLMPTSAMAQVIAQPLFIDDTGDGGNSGIAIASPYEGEAKIYSWNDATQTIDLEYTIPLTRNIGPPPSTPDDQFHPAAGGVANESATYPVQLQGDLKAGVIIANVPITVVVQNGTAAHKPTLRSQNGTTTSSITNDDDETLMLGITPDDIKAVIRKGDDGLSYRLAVGADLATWVLA